MLFQYARQRMARLGVVWKLRRNGRQSPDCRPLRYTRCLSIQHHNSRSKHFSMLSRSKNRDATVQKGWLPVFWASIF